MGELGLTYEEYSGLTIAELLWMIDGYNRRWEEEWRHTRHIHTVLLNVNSSKRRFKATEVLPLPSEIRAKDELITVDGQEMTLGEWRNEIRLQAQRKVEQDKNGAGISS